MSVSMLSYQGVRKSQKQNSVNSSGKISVWHPSYSMLGMASLLTTSISGTCTITGMEKEVCEEVTHDLPWVAVWCGVIHTSATGIFRLVVQRFFHTWVKFGFFKGVLYGQMSFNECRNSTSYWGVILHMCGTGIKVNQPEYSCNLFPCFECISAQDTIRKADIICQLQEWDHTHWFHPSGSCQNIPIGRQAGRSQQHLQGSSEPGTHTMRSHYIAHSASEQ